MPLADNIIRLRSQLRLTQVQLARRAGIAQGTLSAIELGQTTNPTHAVLSAIARELGVSPEVLFDGLATSEALNEAMPADLSKLSPVRLAQLNAVKALKKRGEIWQITTNNMDGFAPSGTYIVADVGTDYTQGDLVLAQRTTADDRITTLFRLFMLGNLLYVSPQGVRSTDIINDGRTSVYAVVDRETKV